MTMTIALTFYDVCPVAGAIPDGTMISAVTMATAGSAAALGTAWMDMTTTLALGAAAATATGVCMAAVATAAMAATAATVATVVLPTEAVATAATVATAAMAVGTAESVALEGVPERMAAATMVDTIEICDVTIHIMQPLDDTRTMKTLRYL